MINAVHEVSKSSRFTWANPASWNWTMSWLSTSMACFCSSDLQFNTERFTTWTQTQTRGKARRTACIHQHCSAAESWAALPRQAAAWRRGVAASKSSPSCLQREQDEQWRVNKEQGRLGPPPVAVDVVRTASTPAPVGLPFILRLVAGAGLD